MSAYYRLENGKGLRKMAGISWLLLAAFGLFVLQAFGGALQIQNYRKAIHRVHKFGNVGFGQKRGGLRAGYIVMIACDGKGIITGGEIMEGISSLARFKPLTTLLGRDILGRSIYEFLEELRQFDKKQKKRYKGYINALEALEQRLKEPEMPQEKDEESV